jgi:hypothetical protein
MNRLLDISRKEYSVSQSHKVHNSPLPLEGEGVGGGVIPYLTRTITAI